MGDPPYWLTMLLASLIHGMRLRGLDGHLTLTVSASTADRLGFVDDAVLAVGGGTVRLRRAEAT